MLILAALADQSMHGYAITQWISAKTSSAVTLKPGSLYPLLHTLEDRKLVSHTLKDSPAGPQRKVYRLTKKGRAHFAKQKKDLKSFHKQIGGALK